MDAICAKVSGLARVNGAFDWKKALKIKIYLEETRWKLQRILKKEEKIDCLHYVCEAEGKRNRKQP
jgi:hypothetical protein